MTDLSGVPTDQLMQAAGIQAPPQASDLSGMSTDDLLKAASPLIKAEPTNGEKFAQAIGLDPANSMLGKGIQIAVDRVIQNMRDSPVSKAYVPNLPSDLKEALKVIDSNPAFQQVSRSVALGFAGSSIGDARAAMAPMGSVGSASSLLKDAVPNLTDDEARKALDLLDQSFKRGSPITLPEAVQKASGGKTNLADIQRVVEQSRKGGPIMKEFFSNRPANNAQMVGNAASDVAGGAVGEPSAAAPVVQGAAQGEIDKAVGQVNAASRPAYEATANNPGVLLSDASMTALKKNAAIESALDAVRSNPIKYGDLRGMPDNALPVLDAAKKYLDDVTSASERAGENYAAKNAGTAATTLRDAITSEYPRYASALNIQGAGRRLLVEPLEQSPTGKLAGLSDWAKQAGTILEANPAPGSEKGVADAVSTIVAKDPQAARTLVSAKILQTFNEASQNLSAGPNQFGGAKFASIIRGNSQQAKNLEAAIRALPDGDKAWDGMNQVLNILEAQGTRQPAGSMTEFNSQIAKDMGQSGLKRGAALAMAPTRLMSVADDLYQKFTYGQNAKLFARIFTDPQAITEMQTLRQLKPQNLAARAVVVNIIANYLSRNIQQPANQQPQQPQ